MDRALSQNAIDDEPEHRAFLERCGLELTGMEAPRRTPATCNAVTRKHLDNLCSTIGRAVADALEPLTKRIAELEAEKGLRYVGPWRPNSNYLPGEFCSYGGSVWHCRSMTGTKPGKCPEAWQLAV